MSLTNIKLNSQSERGFTIVELLIVVVVIAILAAITIVSYNGITNRANQSAAKSVAATAQKKAELYNSEVGHYPVTTSALTSATSDKSYATPASTFATGTGNQTEPTSSNGTKQVQLLICAAGADDLSDVTTSTITGIRIGYWDFGETNGTPDVYYVDMGTNVGDTTCFAPAS